MELEARVRQSFERQTFMHHIGAEITHVSEGKVEITCPFAEGLTQQHGLFHGGVIATLADNSMGCRIQHNGG